MRSISCSLRRDSALWTHRVEGTGARLQAAVDHAAIVQAAVDVHFDLDQAAFGALVDRHVVERDDIEDCLAAACDLGLQQHARFGDEVAVEDGAENAADGGRRRVDRQLRGAAERAGREWNRR